MVVSIPTAHPDAPPREGLVLGKYESVEIIREIPLTLPKSASTTNLHKFREDASPNRQRGNTIGFAESRGSSAKGERMDKHEETHVDDEAETNPIEWIMVTRSDPGGGIPRFMVDRGTPSSITADVPKFLDWACGKDRFINEEEVANNAETPDTDAQQASAHPPTNGRPVTPDRSLTASHEPPPSQGGLLSSLTSAVEGSIAAYAPTSVQETLAPYIHPNGEPGTTTAAATDDYDYSTDTSSLDSFASAEQFRTAEDIPGGSASTSQQALASTTSLSATTSPTDSPSSSAPSRIYLRASGPPSPFWRRFRTRAASASRAFW